MKSLIATVLVLILLLVSYYLFKPKTKETIQYSQAETVIEAGKIYSATLHTSVGDITIELDSINTPITANNFVFLAQA
ncbi:peptidylprolyl isomerase, partial [Patescibacteria group bacterium]|nr:peptidylprolyl isomerase [Patescibacteria group bacterium]